MRNKFFVCFLFFMCGWYAAAAGIPELLPWPQHVTWKSERFPLREVQVVSDVWGDELADVLQDAGAIVSERAGRKVEVKIVDSIPGAGVNPDEAYRLRVNRDRIVIEAVTGKGVYWAIQTLRQLVVREEKVLLLPAVRLPTGLLSVYVDLCTIPGEGIFLWRN